MELRIENARGKWRIVKSEQDKFYKALGDAVYEADKLNAKIDPNRLNDMFYAVANHGVLGTVRVFVKKIHGGFAYVVDRPVNPRYDAWLHVSLLQPGGEKPKREVSPERREKLAQNLIKARAARSGAKRGSEGGGGKK